MFFKVVCVNDFSDDEISCAFSQLSSFQREHIGKKTGLHFKQSVVSRIVINDLLLQHFAVSDGYNITLDVNGKPHYNNDEFYVSISHSGEFVACAVSDKNVGIDIQRYKEVSDRLINRVCTLEEINYIKLTNRKSFIQIWTAKEAFAKYSKMFLYRTFEISFVNSNSIGIIQKDSPEFFLYSTNDYALTIVE